MNYSAPANLSKVKAHTGNAVEYLAVVLRELEKATPETCLINVALDLAAGNVAMAQTYLSGKDE